MNFTTRNPSFINKKPTTFQAGDRAGLMMWVKQRQSEMALEDLVWGRIKDNGINYVVEGYLGHSMKWVRIPCRRLLDARLFLGSVMSRLDFDLCKEIEGFTK
tara:strand:+ start:1670 stop:1975 length:306 start_codon:yes stop_codon:yes gene_type:complete